MPGTLCHRVTDSRRRLSGCLLGAVWRSVDARDGYPSLQTAKCRDNRLAIY
jgi:hypothetical protein